MKFFIWIFVLYKTIWSSGVKEYPSGIIELHDDIVSRQAHNFPVPEDILELSRDFEVMSAREFVYRS